MLWFTDDERAVAAKRPPLCRADSRAAAAARSGRLRVARPPTLDEGEALTQFHYSQLRLSVAFHAALGFDRVLFFESDTVLCANPTVPWRAWLAAPVDYVGAPWPAGVEWCRGVEANCCCNAGLSLVDVAAFSRLFASPAAVAARARRNDALLEAQCDMLYLELYGANDLGGFALAAPRVAATFSVEAVPAPDGVVPFGLHKPWWALADFPRDLDSVARTCPEVALLCPYAKAALSNANPRHDATPFLKTVCNHDAAEIAAHKVRNEAQHHFERDH